MLCFCTIPAVLSADAPQEYRKLSNYHLGPSQQAWRKVDEAQRDNHYNLGGQGHAGRAKELLSQASEAIRLSADADNDHR
jgi:hypothetical protein